VPKIAVYKFLTFFVYSFDVLHEPPHLHVVKEKGKRQRSAKFWLFSMKIAERGTLTDKELNLASKIIKLHKKQLLHKIREIRSGKRITTMTIK